MKIKHVLSTLLLSSLSFLAAAQQENSELDPINMSAYLSLMDGDRAMRRLRREIAQLLC